MNQSLSSSDKLVSLNMRVDSGKRDLIDRAVAELGSDRTSFIMGAACRRAEDVLLDRKDFVLNDSVFDAFESSLEGN